MRKVLLAIMIVLGLLFCDWGTDNVAWATASSIVKTSSIDYGQGYSKVTITCTGDSTNGTFTSTSLPVPVGWITRVETNPGSPAPDSNYDITLTNANGLDMAQGNLANRSATVTQFIETVNWQTDGSLTVNISGNTVNSAIIVIEVYIGR